MTWAPATERYEEMVYRRCGRSGLLLPAISLGLWQNFGSSSPAGIVSGYFAPGVRPRHYPL